MIFVVLILIIFWFLLSKCNVVLERGFFEKLVICLEIDSDRGVNDIVIFVVFLGVIVVFMIIELKFVVLVNMLYFLGFKFFVMKFLFWLVIVFLIGIRFFVENICIIVLVNDIFVCKLFIVLVSILGLGVNEIFWVMVWFGLIVKLIVFFWNLGFVVIRLYVLGVNFCVWKFLLMFVWVIVIVILLILIICISVFIIGCFVCLFVMIFWMVLGFGGKFIKIVDIWFDCIKVEEVCDLKFGLEIIIV